VQKERLPSASAESGPIIINTLPAFITRLALALAPGNEISFASEYSNLALAHGNERAKMTGYSLAEVIHEYQILREILMRTFRSETRLAPEEWDIVHRSIDEAMAEAATAYVQVQQRFRDLFTAALTHDFRGPLSNAMNYIDLIGREYVPGATDAVVDLGGVIAGLNICFDIVDDQLMTEMVEQGAQIVFAQTNNADFGFTDESVQQLAMSRLRAIETGRSVVHISTVGVSAIYGPDGAQLASSGHFTPEVLQARIPLRSGTTPAVRIGALPEALLASLGLGIALGGFFVTRRGRRAVRPNAKQT
jgi:signal transduction histidine kinase